MGFSLFASLQRPHCSSPFPQPSPASSNYRPAVILPGLGNNSGDYQKLEQTLNNKYGVPTVVAKVSRLDWLRNAAGLVDPNYWRGTLQPRPVLDWYIEGAQIFGKSNPNVQSAVPVNGSQPVPEAAIVNAASSSTPNTTTLRARFVGQGYKQVCGQADVWGDGVVPEVSAHLEGALNISLDGVYHSPVGSDDELRPWYGSPAVLEKWVVHLLN